jgi:pimeloyl-ACP methyl ester carboxylesterase
MVSYLLLRGLGRSARHWGELPAALRDAASAEVVCLDLPGAGTEVSRRSPRSVAAITDDVRRRFLPLAGQRRWILVGISLGGMVAMDWCARYAGDFAAVALLNTSAGDVARPWERMRLGVLPNVIRSLLDPDATAREARILGMTTGRVDAARRQSIAAKWAAYPAMTRGSALSQIVAGARFRAPAALPVPALVVAGGGDALCASTASIALATRFAAPLRVHPDAGHDLATDVPVWTAGVIASWAKERGEGAPATQRT